MFVPDLEFAASSSLSEVTGTIGSSVLVRRDPNRCGLWVMNNSPTPMVISTAASCSFANYSVLVGAYALWEMPRPVITDGLVFCHQTATGSAMVTQFFRA